MSKEGKKEAMQKALEATLARVGAIRKHLDTAPRRGRLAGKVAIVTGANSLTGIGRATARLFAHEGAKHLYCSDYADENLAELKSWLNKLYPDVKVDVVKADAASEEQVEALVERAIKDEGQLDIFFANAGIAPIHMLGGTDASEVAEVLRINTIGPFLAVKYASQAMQQTSTSKKQPGGSIILTASVAGLNAGAGFIDYSASKSAVISMAKTSAWELSGTGIRVNAVCPGLIETGMTEVVFSISRERGTEGKIGQLNPTRRYGVAEEIANGVLFLASDEASYVNGIAMPIDGGLSASHPIAGLGSGR